MSQFCYNTASTLKMKKKPTVVIRTDNDKNKRKTLSKSSTTIDSNMLSDQKKYPIVVTKDGNVPSDSSLKDLDNLSDSDDSSTKIRKINRKTITHKLKKDDDSSITSYKKETAPKKSKRNTSKNKTALTSSIPRKVSSCQNSVTSVVSQSSSKSSYFTKEDGIKQITQNIVSTPSSIASNVPIGVTAYTTLENNIDDDMGINVEDIPVPTTPNGNNSTPGTASSGSQKLPEALLRCAYIQNENSQTVVFWCEELTKWAFKCQNKIMLDIRDGKNWVTREIPFASQVAEPPYFLYLYRNNVYMKGIHGTFGIRLFHYTLRTRFQNEVNMKNTARRICGYVNGDCKANLIFDENRLFLYNRPCVWSNLIGKQGAIDKLVRDTNEVLNDKYSSNPRFWDNHIELIKKFFFINKLQVDVAELFNAPLENIDPCIERTADLVRSVSLRRNSIPAENESQMALQHPVDPEDEVFVDNVETSNTQVSASTDTQHNNGDTESTAINGDPENESTD